MTCNKCGEKPKKGCGAFPRAVIEIDNPEKIVLLRKVLVPASMGDESTFPPTIGKYHNVLLEYEASGGIYLYSSDGIPTEIFADVDALQAQVDELSAELDGEEETRHNADVALSNRITEEKNARIQSDNALGDRLTTVEGIASTALQPASIDQVVMTDLSLNNNTSTTTVQLDAAKKNLLSGATSTKNIALPVASSQQAGVMNSATFDAVTQNKDMIEALTNGAVAISGLPASPTQAEITTAWKNETGFTDLINRASVYDVTNNKVWTYYTNDQTWHATTNTTQVVINTFTNSSEGTIKGSTNIGQVFAESNGTGSVNGWDNLSNAVSTNTANIEDLQDDMETKQDVLTAGNAIDITDNVINAHIYPADFFTAGDMVSGKNVSIELEPVMELRLIDISLFGNTMQLYYTGRNMFDFSKVVDKTSTVDNTTILEVVPTGVVAVGDTSASTTLNDIANGWYSPAKASVNSAARVHLEAGETATFSASISLAELGLSATTAIGVYNGTTDMGVGEDHPVYLTSPVRISRTFTASTAGDYSPYFTMNSNTLKIKNIQVEKGSTMNDYEPYVGALPSPNPDYPQAVQVAANGQTMTMTGKNLFNKNNYTYLNGYFHSGEQITETEVGRNIIVYIPCAPSTTYSISAQTGLRLASRIISSTAEKPADMVLAASNGKSGLSALNYTTTANARYLIIRMQAEEGLTMAEIVDDAIANFQIELGESSTAYETYKEQVRTVQLGNLELCKIDGFQDHLYKDGDDWYVHKEIGKDTITSVTATYGGVGSGYIGAFVVKSDMKPAIEAGSGLRGFCDKLIAISTPQGATREGITFGSNNDDIYIVLNSSRMSGSTASNWNAWLTNNPLTVYYVLNTPTDTKITDAALISDLETMLTEGTFDDFAVLTSSTADPTKDAAEIETNAYRKSLRGLIRAVRELTA